MTDTNIGYDTMRVITQAIGFTISTEFRLLQERQTQAVEVQNASAQISIFAGALALLAMITGIVLLMLNLNQIATAQALSAENEERFRSLLESAPDAMVMADQDGTSTS